MKIIHYIWQDTEHNMFPFKGTPLQQKRYGERFAW